jgi:hypothetical protein
MNLGFEGYVPPEKSVSEEGARIQEPGDAGLVRVTRAIVKPGPKVREGTRGAIPGSSCVSTPRTLLAPGSF